MCSEFQKCWLIRKGGLPEARILFLVFISCLQGALKISSIVLSNVKRETGLMWSSA